MRTLLNFYFSNNCHFFVFVKNGSIEITFLKYILHIFETWKKWKHAMRSYFCEYKAFFLENIDFNFNLKKSVHFWQIQKKWQIKKKGNFLKRSQFPCFSKINFLHSLRFSSHLTSQNTNYKLHLLYFCSLLTE